LFLAFIKAIADPERVSSQITKLDTIGAATCMQGYNALDGFGTTLTINQIVAIIDIIINTTLAGTLNSVKYSIAF